MFQFIQQTENLEYLGMYIDEQYYCINIQILFEIIYIPVISKLPNVPSYIEGVINLRGKIIRIINLRKWFGLPWKAYSKKSRILIVGNDEQTFGLLVDAVDEVFKITPEMIQELPRVLESEAEIIYIKKILLVNDQIRIEIDPNMLQQDVGKK